MDEDIKDLYRSYEDIKDQICARLDDFRCIRDGDCDSLLFDEMAFCIFTPQSKAKSCWAAVEELKERKLFEKGKADEISDAIKKVRFRNRKASYFSEARKKFGVDGRSLRELLSRIEDSLEAREWLVRNVKGLGYKEASHFLRNIGMGDDIAILDRHILRNLVRYGVIDEFPSNITPSKYMEIENCMREFSRDIGIPLSHLDLLLWYRETGEIFK